MLKYFSISATILLIAMNSANAQQQEAVLQKIEVPNAAFDIVLAMAKPGGTAINLRNQPDPRVVYLMGGELVSAYVGEMQKVFKEIGALTVPACAFHVAGKDGQAHTPIGIYVVPKHRIPFEPATR
jgi:hypothetical protein